ncbi:MAG: hypothetical protein KIS91_18055 [Anaerolineae bacterium]|nr:hypothetical protein [Anaerolineae bacterium]
MPALLATTTDTPRHRGAGNIAAKDAVANGIAAKDARADGIAEDEGGRKTQRAATGDRPYRTARMVGGGGAT